MSIFNRLRLGLLVVAGLILAGSLAHGAPPYGGGGLRDHGHTAPGDGGVLANPSITTLSVSTLTVTSTASIAALGFTTGTVNGYIRGQGTYSVPAIQVGTNSGLYTFGGSGIGFSGGGAQMGSWTTSQLLNGYGSASSPSFGWLSDNDTGIYRPAGNQVGISGNGSAIITFSTSAITAYAPIFQSSSSLVVATAGSGESIANNTWTLPTFSTEYADVLSEFSSSIFTANTTGTYNVHGYVIFATTSSVAGTRQVELRSSTSVTPFTPSSITYCPVPAANQFGTCDIDNVVVIPQGSNVYLRVFQDSGASLSIQQLYFSVSRIK